MDDKNMDTHGRCPDGPGCQPSASAAEASSQSGIPNAGLLNGDRFDDDLMFDVCGNIGCNEGWVTDCFDGLCINAEDGCALGLRRCDWCNAKAEQEGK